MSVKQSFYCVYIYRYAYVFLLKVESQYNVCFSLAEGSISVTFQSMKIESTVELPPNWNCPVVQLKLT